MGSHGVIEVIQGCGGIASCCLKVAHNVAIASSIDFTLVVMSLSDAIFKSCVYVVFYEVAHIERTN